MNARTSFAPSFSVPWIQSWPSMSAQTTPNTLRHFRLRISAAAAEAVHVRGAVWMGWLRWWPLLSPAPWGMRSGSRAEGEIHRPCGADAEVDHQIRDLFPSPSQLVLGCLRWSCRRRS